MYIHYTSVNFAMAREIAHANKALATYFAVVGKETVPDDIVTEVFKILPVNSQHSTAFLA